MNNFAIRNRTTMDTIHLKFSRKNFHQNPKINQAYSVAMMVFENEAQPSVPFLIHFIEISPFSINNVQ